MLEESWVTYYRVSGGSVTKKGMPANWRPTGFPNVREATPIEIEMAAKAEAKREQRKNDTIAFNNREDFQIADSIRSLLENMDCYDHPLGALTLDEWRELERRLRG